MKKKEKKTIQKWKIMFGKIENMDYKTKKKKKKKDDTVQEIKT